jgi:hypothetical protein
MTSIMRCINAWSLGERGLLVRCWSLFDNISSGNIRPRPDGVGIAF